MPGTYSTAEVLKDVKGYPVACYFNPVTGLYEIMTGSNGAPNFQAVDGGIVTLGSKADAAVTDPTLSATEIAILKGLLKQLQGNGVGALPISVSGSNTNDIVLQNAATATGDGTVHTIITGKETITLVASGTATSFTVQFQVQGSDGNWYLTNGVNVGTGGGSGVVGSVGSNAQTSQMAAFGQVYQIDLSGWKAFKAALTAMSGGNVTVNGRLTFA